MSSWVNIRSYIWCSDLFKASQRVFDEAELSDIKLVN